jgi:hypothetical protein
MTPALARITLLAGGILLVALNLPGCGGSNIPIGEEPTCTDLVTDECVPEVIEEFCSTQSTPEELLTLHVEQYERGFEDGVASVEFECPDGYICLSRADFDEYSTGICEYCEERADCEEATWTCADFEDGRPNGHKPKECRGKGHE